MSTGNLSTSFRILTESDNRFLSHEQCVALEHRIRGMVSGGGTTSVGITSTWAGDFRWARNRVSAAAERRDDSIAVTRNIGGAAATTTTNQITDLSLQRTVKLAERMLRLRSKGAPDRVEELPISHEFPDTKIWSERTYNQNAGERETLLRQLVAPAEQAGMVSAGYLSVAASGSAVLSGDAIDNYYYPQTIAQCSITVRDPDGTGSGWAGASSYDATRFDPMTLATTALNKCLASRNPIRIEPGRYTVILEPQAFYQLLWPLFDPQLNLFERALQEGVEGRDQSGIFAEGKMNVMVDGLPIALGDSRLGKRIADRRISIGQDPLHPDLGTLPLADGDNPYKPVTWVDHGVLTALVSNRSYALHQWRENEGFPNSGAFKVSFDGPTTSTEEMIASTKRGVLVTRFGPLSIMDPGSVLLGGVTRDGLWLIENGKISKPIRNFWVAESPFFVLNRIEQVGTPVPVFSPGVPAVIPPIKVADFSFPRGSDAV